MTAPAETLTGEQAITYGWQVYRRIAGIAWPDPGRKAIGRASVDLWTALEMHGRLEGEPGSLAAKYEQQARDAWERLIAVVRDKCGDKDADFVARGRRSWLTR